MPEKMPLTQKHDVYLVVHLLWVVVVEKRTMVEGMEYGDLIVVRSLTSVAGSGFPMKCPLHL